MWTIPNNSSAFGSSYIQDVYLLHMLRLSIFIMLICVVTSKATWSQLPRTVFGWFFNIYKEGVLSVQPTLGFSLPQGKKRCFWVFKKYSYLYTVIYNYMWIQSMVGFFWLAGWLLFCFVFIWKIICNIWWCLWLTSDTDSSQSTVIISLIQIISTCDTWHPQLLVLMLNFTLSEIPPYSSIHF